MRYTPLPSRESILSVLSYDPETGVFWWKARGDLRPSQRSRLAGTRAGTVMNCGYRMIRIFRKNYLAHRLAWVVIHGDVPIEQVDHVNHVNMDKDDNRSINLRAATSEQNHHNTAGWSGRPLPKGVYRCRRKFTSRIKVAKVDRYLGVFDTIEETQAAYAAAAKEYFGEFARAS